MVSICVYAISLNEEQFAERWARSAKDADCIFVADTGSTDKTLQILKKNKVQTQSIIVRPWRFDDARNASLNLLPKVDIAIALDMDEILLPGWRRIVEENWKDGCNRLRYQYTWSWFHDVPDVVYSAEKIHGRFTHRWRHPVHEILKPTVPEIVRFTGETLIEHHADDSKPRSQYLPLLELAVAEDPQDDRNSHYLGREYHNTGQYQRAIDELYRHLDLPSAKWNAERAASMRYIAKSFERLGNMTETNYWYTMATLEDPSSKEALVDMAKFTLSRNLFHQTAHCCELALNIPDGAGFYLNERYAQKEGPYELAGVAYWHLGNHDKAIELTKKALSLNPHNTLALDNLKMMQKA